MILALLFTWLLLSVLVSLALGRAMASGPEMPSRVPRSVERRLDRVAAA